MAQVDVVLYPDGTAEIEGVDYRTMLNVVSVEVGADSGVYGSQGVLVLKAPTARFSKGYKQGVETVPAKYLVLYIIGRRSENGLMKVRCQFVTDFLIREREWPYSKTRVELEKIAAV